ncbi:MAG TPA: hypothetical protein VEU95_05315, partial [Micropepsaceae bacterium]|nr:hypothetical protein [Micropepsaceae bacterium]
MGHSMRWGWAAAAFAFALGLAGPTEAQPASTIRPQPIQAAPARPQPGTPLRGPIAPTPGSQPVDVQIVLAIDASGSVDDERFEL